MKTAPTTGTVAVIDRKHRPIEQLLEHEAVFQCLILAGLGFSDRYIMQKTRLTRGQLAYYLKRAGLKRRFYRDGKSIIAQSVEGHTRKFVAKEIEARLDSEKGLQKLLLADQQG